MKEKIKGFLSRIKEITANENLRSESGLPENCFFLKDGDIACFRRDIGDSRYPYSAEGFTLWAHSSGYVSINESTFYVLLPASGGKEPFFTVYGGIKQGEKYEPVSVFEVGALPGESGCVRYTVYTPQAVYYIAEKGGVLFAVRAFVTDDKRVCFTVYAENTGVDTKELYLSPYLNCLLKHDTAECVETNWFKECRTTANGYLFESVEDLDRTTHLDNYGVITRGTDNTHPFELQVTTARTVYTGGTNRPIMCSECLNTGNFKSVKTNTRFTDTAVAAEIIKFKLAPGESFKTDYRLTCAYDKKSAESLVEEQLSADGFQEYLSRTEELFLEKQKEFTDMKFYGLDFGKVNCSVLNNFIKSVERQVEFAALAKNSGVSLLGVRDVFQQLEAALMWNPSACRSKILEALGFIGNDGRPPRQYSIPPKDGALPRMDLRPFIDQGVWIIDTVYSYLSFTGDYSILNEVCGYYEFKGNTVLPCNEKDRVLAHLIRIVDYMVSKIDYKYTNCLRAIYGDWNDALDGLGVSIDGSEEYGSGVSVMATLQLYRNLEQMIEILARVSDKSEKIGEYVRVRESLRKGLETYAIESNGNSRKILHGWGDKVSYKVGSYRDTDGASRDGLTASAFWVISDKYREDDSLREDILGSFRRLDSKYGLKTFEPYFPLGMKGVGRIVNLPRGTAENAATYVHATLFGIWALFKMGEPQFAWEQLYKVLPITHEKLSTTPFIMSNSYSYNEEYGLDGESMSDWFTGSANVLIKVLVRCVFGVNPDLGGVWISPAAYVPANGTEITVKAKGATINIRRNCAKKGTKRFFINEKEVPSVCDKYMRTDKIYIKNEQLNGLINITIEG